jgi:hypothetical protein
LYRHEQDSNLKNVSGDMHWLHLYNVVVNPTTILSRPQRPLVVALNTININQLKPKTSTSIFFLPRLSIFSIRQYGLLSEQLTVNLWWQSVIVLLGLVMHLASFTISFKEVWHGKCYILLVLRLCWFNASCIMGIKLDIFILFLLALGVNATYCYSCADSTRHVCASAFSFIYHIF